MIDDWLVTYMSAAVLISIVAIILGTILWGAVVWQIWTAILNKILTILSGRKVLPQIALVVIFTIVLWYWKQQFVTTYQLICFLLGTFLLISIVTFVAGMIIFAVGKIKDYIKNKKK